jgi:hypothetical protein
MGGFRRRLSREQRRNVDRLAAMLPGELEAIRNRSSAGELLRAQEAARDAAEARRAIILSQLSGGGGMRHQDVLLPRSFLNREMLPTSTNRHQ